MEKPGECSAAAPGPGRGALPNYGILELAFPGCRLWAAMSGARRFLAAILAIGGHAPGLVAPADATERPLAQRELANFNVWAATCGRPPARSASWRPRHALEARLDDTPCARHVGGAQRAAHVVSAI